MSVLQDLEPRDVFGFFEEIAGIPHGSGNTKAISDYCVDFARKRNLRHLQDESGNVVIWKPAAKGHEEAAPVILQGHLDMVLQQAEENTLDMEREGLKLGVKGDDIHASGTTLGGDDGIAVAYMLALLNGDYAHPALECVFTVDEEIGLLGAEALDMSVLEGKRMINLDSEEEGIFTVGCAGGLTGECTLPVKRVPVEGVLYEISLEGLKGGHSGAEIQKERGNSHKLTARLLARLDERLSFALVALEGGRVDNAIPGQTVCSLLVDAQEEDVLLEEARAYEAVIRHELRASDPEVRLVVKREGAGMEQALDPRSKALVIYLLHMIPNGVWKRSVEIDDLVQTSCNLGVVKLLEDALTFTHSVRSSVESEKLALSDQVRLLTEFLGGSYEARGVYPGWEYQKDTKLERVMAEVFREQYQREPRIIAIHAGLECGIFSSRIEGFSCVSIGPDIRDIHSFRERLSISSARRVWEFLLQVLERF